MSRRKQLAKGASMATRARCHYVLALGPLAVHLAATPAWAQKTVVLVDDSGSWLQWAIAAGVTIVVCFSAFLNSKRSHLT